MTAAKLIDRGGSPLCKATAYTEALASLLAPGGYLFVVTDNFRSDVAERRGAEFPKWIPHAHVSHLDPSTPARSLDAVTGLEPAVFHTFTPWELFAGAALGALRPRRAASAAYSFAQECVSEKERSYRLFAARRFLNPFWFRRTVSTRRGGALMCAVTRRRE